MRSGAYANTLVAATSVDPVEAHGFYQRLVYTTLRFLPAIDRVLAASSSRPLDKVDPFALAVMRVATAEMRYLSTEPYAAVNEAVESVAASRLARARGFVNAALRSVAEQPPSGAWLLTDSYPEPLVTLLGRDLGQPVAEAFLTASNDPAPTGIRYRGAEGVGESRYADPELDDIVTLESAGTVDIIDPASVAVAQAVAAIPGDIVVDLAAAPGGKTRALGDAVTPSGLVVGSDIHPRRLQRAAQRHRTPESVRWVIGDGSQAPFRDATADRVLVDAPCTGLGTMRRRPEIRYRFSPDAPARYRSVQRHLVEEAMRIVRPGGRIVYSVCTVTTAETHGVIEGLGFHGPTTPLGIPWGDGTLLGPHLAGTDGMFIAAFDA
jgi:16S rRNA (cytosine967-C5)-methyltransferase